MWRIFPRKDTEGDQHTVYHFHNSVWDFLRKENAKTLRYWGENKCFVVTWMALEMLPLYIKTNQWDGKNYCCGGRWKEEGWSNFHHLHH